MNLNNMLIDQRTAFNLEIRAQLLDIMAVALRMYQKTKKEMWMDYYKWFEEAIKKFK